MRGEQVRERGYMRKPQSWGEMGPIDRGGEGKRRVRGEDSETTFWGEEGSETS